MRAMMKPVVAARAHHPPTCAFQPARSGTARSVRHRLHHAWNKTSSSHQPEMRERLLRTYATASQPPAGLSCEPWTGTPEQQKALEQLKQMMAKGPNGVPDEETLQWFLRDRYFIVQDAADKLNSMLSWRNSFQPGPVNFADIAAEHATGKSIVHDALDKLDRPAIIITARHHVTGAFPIDTSKRLCVHTIDSAIAMLPPGKEQIIGIFDLRGFEAKNMDIAFVKFMIDAFFEYYPKRVGQVLFVDAPWVFQPAWQVIKPLMRKYAALVQFVSSEQVRTQYFTPETAPKAFL